MIDSLRRIFVGVLVVVPLVGVVAAALLLAPQAVSLIIALVGVAGLMAAEAFHSKPAAAAGGVLAMGGVLAWALLAAKIVAAGG